MRGRTVTLHRSRQDKAGWRLDYSDGTSEEIPNQSLHTRLTALGFREAPSPNQHLALLKGQALPVRH